MCYGLKEQCLASYSLGRCTKLQCWGGVGRGLRQRPKYIVRVRKYNSTTHEEKCRRHIRDPYLWEGMAPRLPLPTPSRPELGHSLIRQRRRTRLTFSPKSVSGSMGVFFVSQSVLLTSTGYGRCALIFCARSGTSPSGSLGLLLCARRHWCTVTAQAAGSEISAGKARAGLYKLSCCLSCIMT